MTLSSQPGSRCDPEVATVQIDQKDPASTFKKKDTGGNPEHQQPRHHLHHRHPEQHHQVDPQKKEVETKINVVIRTLTNSYVQLCKKRNDTKSPSMRCLLFNNKHRRERSEELHC